MHRNLSPAAQTGHVMNDLRSYTLLSAGQRCNDTYTMVLDEHKAHVYKDNNFFLSGDRNPQDGLWEIQFPIVKLPKRSHQVINVIIRQDTSNKYLAEYLYKSYLIPLLSTFNKAINNDQFITWPSMNDKIVGNNLKKQWQQQKATLTKR